MARNTSPTTELSLSFEALRLNHEKKKEDGEEEEEGSINPSQIINHNGGLEWRENSSRVNQSNYSYATTTEPVKQECIQKSNHLFKENHNQQDSDTLRRDCSSSEATPCVCSCHSQDDRIACLLCDCHTVQSSLPDQHHQAVGVVGGGAVLSTCRQEAMYSDVSVEELAGYFDELLYLPRPMSVMAELMYT
ncbi:PREDICTED: oxidative stress-responsive serine-rich protein 1-like [Amphimedon queenslandica]|uniref:Oxidative stress-responsive serine-rich protein 1 n=1 Tax=Amphimedon queenslandica TaxID=400682 RepID=A0A1X7UGZ3_AMPQE|nr:PREDICTED: oxidative stress-responsive serine-rich protein 1-like [Amphimedon queenslandica]|eukprot:XP_003387872.1 PREDICTED: oxidative stress-responsive serine-rich protein 1-like [Amphimedon queenslandica]